MARLWWIALVLSSAGCGILPDVTHQPVINNPFPQLSRVAVAPFFNQSEEPTLDARSVALAYYAQLQSVPGFEVVPVSVVENAMRAYQIRLDNPSDARRLAQLLDVDAIVVGSVTDYTPYYPPRMALAVEWWSANPCFHPIPPGYGLPWGTTEEEFIPQPLIFEAEMALARAQLATQTPEYNAQAVHSGPPPAEPRLLPVPANPDHPPSKPGNEGPAPPLPDETEPPGRAVAHHERLSDERLAGDPSAPASWPLPPDWPDARGFVPPPPSAERPVCKESDQPVLRHTKIYEGNNTQVTEALASYDYFRDDARSGGWQSYLQRSDDFIRFCCHLHISEMLSARGGAGETRVVWRWFRDR